MAKAWHLHRCSTYNTVLHSTVPLTRSVDSSHETTLVFPFGWGARIYSLFFPCQSSSALSVKHSGMSHSFCVILKVPMGSCGRWPALMQGGCVVLCRPMWALSPSALRLPSPNVLPALLVSLSAFQSSLLLCSGLILPCSFPHKTNGMSCQLRWLLKDLPPQGWCSMFPHRGPLWPCVHRYYVCRQ